MSQVAVKFPTSRTIVMAALKHTLTKVPSFFFQYVKYNVIFSMPQRDMGYFFAPPHTHHMFYRCHGSHVTFA